MTPQVQNPARLRKPRIPATTDELVMVGKTLAEAHRHVHGGKTLSNVPRRSSAAGLTHPKTYLTLAGYEQVTPHAIKERRARKAKNKVAKQSRKVNR